MIANAAAVCAASCCRLRKVCAMQEFSSPDASSKGKRATEAAKPSSPTDAPRRRWTLCGNQRSVALQQPVSLDELLVELERQAKIHRNSRRFGQVMTWVMFSLGMLLAVKFVVGGLHTGHWSSASDWSFFSSFAGLAGMGAVTKQYKNSAQQLADVDDLRAVGPLADALATGDKDMRAVAEEPLMRLLPRLQASDSALLNVTQREALVNALWKAKPEFALVVLKALEQIGDEKALPMVERLARGDKDIDARVTEAAKECLPALRMRAENAKAAQTLLRGSGISNVAPDTLVRPAMPLPVEPADQLLRAAALGAEHVPQELLRAAPSETSPEVKSETARSIAERYTDGDITSRSQLQAGEAASHVP